MKTSPSGLGRPELYNFGQYSWTLHALVTFSFYLPPPPSPCVSWRYYENKWHRTRRWGGGGGQKEENHMTNGVMRVRCLDCLALVWQFHASTTSALDPLFHHLTVLLGEAPPHCDSEFCGGQVSKRIEVCLIHERLLRMIPEPWASGIQVIEGLEDCRLHSKIHCQLV